MSNPLTATERAELRAAAIEYSAAIAPLPSERDQTRLHAAAWKAIQLLTATNFLRLLDQLDAAERHARTSAADVNAVWERQTGK